MSGRRLLAGWLLLIVAVGLPPARGHPADEARPRIELRIDIAESGIDYTAFLPTRVFLEDVVERESLEAYRSMEEDARAERIEAYFHATHPVKVDGIKVRPVFQGIELYAPEPFFASDMSEEERAMEFGTFSVSLRYETKGTPGRVAFVWQRYLETVPPPTAPARGAPAGGEQGGRSIQSQEEGGSNTAQDKGASEQPGKEERPSSESDSGDADKVKRTDPVIAVLSTEWDRRAQLIRLTEEEPEHLWHGEGGPPVPESVDVATERPNATVWVPALSAGLLGLGVVSLLTLRAAGAPGRVSWGSGGVSLIAAAACLGVGWVEVELPWERRLERPADSEALAIFESLHRNIYRAFDHDSESAIYDTLAQSVGGSELETIYGNVYHSLILREEGGAVAQVRSVDVLEKEIVPEPDRGPEAGEEGFHIRCRWRVHGQVRHWGHTHNRTNEFEAIYAVAPRTGSWKIVGSRVLEQERLPNDADGAVPASGS